MAGLKLSELVSGVRTIPVPFGQHTITVSYLLSQRTPEANAEIDAVFGSVTSVICKLVDSWDLVDDDENPIPIDEDHVVKVPVPVLRKIITEIYGDSGLGEVVSSSDAG